MDFLCPICHICWPQQLRLETEHLEYKQYLKIIPDAMEKKNWGVGSYLRYYSTDLSFAVLLLFFWIFQFLLYPLSPLAFRDRILHRREIQFFLFLRYKSCFLLPATVNGPSFASIWFSWAGSLCLSWADFFSLSMGLYVFIAFPWPIFETHVTLGLFSFVWAFFFFAVTAQKTCRRKLPGQAVSIPVGLLILCLAHCNCSILAC